MTRPPLLLLLFLCLSAVVSASSICTPSRAALLTGSYPRRVCLHGGVLFPASTTGLHPDEHTIADHLPAHHHRVREAKTFPAPRPSSP